MLNYMYNIKVWRFVSFIYNENGIFGFNKRGNRCNFCSVGLFLYFVFICFKVFIERNLKEIDILFDVVWLIVFYFFSFF